MSSTFFGRFQQLNLPLIYHSFSLNKTGSVFSWYTLSILLSNKSFIQYIENAWDINTQQKPGVKLSCKIEGIHKVPTQKLFSPCLLLGWYDLCYHLPISCLLLFFLDISMMPAVISKAVVATFRIKAGRLCFHSALQPRSIQGLGIMPCFKSLSFP